MTTHYYQSQEQEDLMADFDAPRKEVRKESHRGCRELEEFLSDFDDNSRLQVDKPTLKSNFFRQPDSLKLQTKLDDTVKCASNKSDLMDNKEDVAQRRDLRNETIIGKEYSPENWEDQYDIPDVSFDEEVFTSESFNLLLEEIKKVITAQAGVLRNVDPLNEVLDSCIKIFDIVWEIPKYEEELKFITAAGLVCYGGSWTTLARIIAAAEIFNVMKVVEEAKKVATMFFYEDCDCEYDVTPYEIRACFKNVGLHLALMIAIVLYPGWGEICLSIAVATKFSCLFSADELLKGMLSAGDIPKPELDDYFGLVDPEWFDLFSLFACVILSLIFCGCFPQMVTAMYMAYLGVTMTVQALSTHSSFYIPFVHDSEQMLSNNLWIDRSTQHYVWAFVYVMAAWQALYGYSGAFEFLSWLMLLLPTVQVHNVIYGESKSHNDKKTE